MKFIVLCLLTTILFTQCIRKNNNTAEVIVSAEWKLDSGDNFDIKLYSDSIYVFSHSNEIHKDEIGEKYKGRYTINHDTINFAPDNFLYLNATKAILKNKYIEFLDGSYPFKMKITKSNSPLKFCYDTLKYKDFAFFTYSPKFYSYFDNEAKPYDLSATDLETIKTILDTVFQENNKKIETSEKYNKQCIAIINSKREKEVWIYCSCKLGLFSKDEFQYRINSAKDGGNCYFSVKLNLTLKTYSELQINGYV